MMRFLQCATFQSTLLITCVHHVFPQTIDSRLLSLAQDYMTTAPTTPTPWVKSTPSVRDHIRIVEAFHRSINDIHYRNIWYGLIVRNYTAFIQQMRTFGPKKFIKKAHFEDRMFEGTYGKLLWNFTIEYFERMNRTHFEQMVELFKEQDDQRRRPTPTKYATIPLPPGYWEKANKEYWATYTDPPGLNPWRNTIPYYRWHNLNYDYIAPKDPNVYPYFLDGRIQEYITRAEWTSTPEPNQAPRPWPKRSWNLSDQWKYDLGVGLRIYTQPDYYY